MTNGIKDIVQWQRDAGLTARDYSDTAEASFQIEEALENFTFEKEFTVYPESPWKMSRIIVGASSGFEGTDVDRIDKACDAIVFAIGAMTKVGLNAQEINHALVIVNDANKAKLGCAVDEVGKLMKPDNFPNPEPRLKALLAKSLKRRSE